ncbi:hypothetical protein GCM10011611_26280 [Aliidongia dinghuensis]|uniref:Uncharacterized protein n=1 Tax=Aliidongia dinghuensis TaxID=1867774 RepID=A0A8J2YTJ1_9PROT|nr:hypothetical protein [Aliidongia dinghuensis]GGF19138.1 hypothetical protein GCM10011611_26280 [Aliidongia dinghuensis]
MAEPTKLLYDLEDLRQIGIELSRVQIDKAERSGAFPGSFTLTGQPQAKRHWLRSAIVEWLEQRAAGAAEEAATKRQAMGAFAKTRSARSPSLIVAQRRVEDLEAKLELARKRVADILVNGQR